MALLPLVVGTRYIITQMTLFFIWAIVVTQWNLVLGVAGIFSLAQMALFAVGAYATAMLGYYFAIPMLLAILVVEKSWLRAIVAGFTAGVAAHLLFAAALNTVSVLFVPLFLSRLWLLGNGLVCIFLAIVLAEEQP